MSDRPEPNIPDNLDVMTPRQAWNASLDAIEPMLGWEAFWNDGQGSDTTPYRVSEAVTHPDLDTLTLLVRDISADHHGNGRLSLSGSEAARIADVVLRSGWLAAHDAEVWERGRVAGGSVAMRRMSDEPGAPDPVNPYLAAGVREEATS